MEPSLSRKKQKETFLSPTREPLKINGRLIYNEGAQAWNIIRLKKEILQEFPELTNKRESFVYKMIVPRTKEALEKHMQELKKTDDLIPILLFLGKAPEGEAEQIGE